MADPLERSFSETDEEIMRATYRALREHGYADLTIKRIATEYGKSTAAIHYHYETKDELLAAFLDYILSQFVETVQGVETIDPEERRRSGRRQNRPVRPAALHSSRGASRGTRTRRF